MLMTRLTSALRLVAAGAALALLAGTALAEEWHGFDPTNFNGPMLPADRRRAMVAEGRKRTPAKNAKSSPFGFATLQRAIPFCQKVEGGIKENAAAAGLTPDTADNRLDGATALANAQSFINRNI